MNTANYRAILCGLKDKVRGKIIHIAIDDNLGAYARMIIPQFKDMYPLNDLEIVEFGYINPYTCEGTITEPQYHNWKEVYEFEITNKAVKDESEISKETDKQ